MTARLEQERIRLVEALRVSELHFDESQRATHIGSWEWEVASGSLWCSDEACRILGLAPPSRDATRAAWLAIVHPDDRLKPAAGGVVSVTSGAPVSTDYRIVRDGGEIRVLREVAEAVRDPHGVPIRFVGTIADVTDAIAADQERTRLVSAVEQTADSIWMQDLNNMVTYVNPAFTETYGYQSEAIVGRHARFVDSTQLSGFRTATGPPARIGMSSVCPTTMTLPGTSLSALAMLRSEG